jgi:hypothetical protein
LTGSEDFWYDRGNEDGRTVGTERKQNCWEFTNCGREPGGTREKEAGICPAAAETRLDTVHHGRNAGRSCWIVAGTLCEGRPQGTFVRKHKNCMSCDFYRLVLLEEKGDFLLSTTLLKKMKFG